MRRYSVPRIYWNRKNRKEWQTSKCLLCDTEFRWKEKVSIGKFCCKKCETGYKKNHTINKVLKGTAGKSACKRYVVETRGYICEECGISDWNKKPLILQLDHIDGNNKNHCLENLKLLCPNCHTQTPTWGKKHRASIG